MPLAQARGLPVPAAAASADAAERGARGGGGSGGNGEEERQQEAARRRAMVQVPLNVAKPPSAPQVAAGAHHDEPREIVFADGAGDSEDEAAGGGASEAPRALGLSCL